jgi:hypothetical protein
MALRPAALATALAVEHRVPRASAPHGQADTAEHGRCGGMRRPNARFARVTGRRWAA